MLQTTTDYTLTINDMAAFRAILKLQGNVGAGMPPPGQGQLFDFFAVLSDMAYNHYRLAGNAQLKSWMDEIFSVVIETNTSYIIDGKSLTAAGMYIIYMYYMFNNTCMVNGLAAPCVSCCHSGFPLNVHQQNIGTWLPPANEFVYNAWPWNFFGPTSISIFFAPTAIPSFYNAFGANAVLLNHGLVLKQGSTDTVAINVVHQDTLDAIQQFQLSRLDPANWTNSNVFVQALQNTSTLQGQAGFVTGMLKEPTLPAGAYIYLLYLLIGLGTSAQPDQQLAQKIVGAPASSAEYPNDTFINQLLYMLLMFYADPLGDFGYDNAELQSALQDIKGVIVCTDAASAAIMQSITKSLKILHSDQSYPMTDPYNPTFGFNTRQSDTLAALDSARSAFN